MSTKIQLFHSQTPGNVPPDGLLVGEVAYNVADNVQFVGYGGDVNYDVNGNPLPDLPPPGMGWKTFVTGGGDQPGPPGPGVPSGGETGQILAKLTDGDYATGWVDNYGPAQPTTVGVVYGLTSTSLGGNSSVFLGFQAGTNIGSGLRNVAIGYQAGLNQNNVDDNVVIGHQAAWNIDGDYNVVVGSEALGNEPGGQATGNVAVGYKAGYNLTEGDGNIFIGYESGQGVRSGAANVIIGNYPGGSDWLGNVAIADGYGNLKFLANQAGAWSTDGLDFGEPDFVLTSQGDGLPPVWKEVPLGFVSRIIAGDNITIDPTDGVGVVTINATGGGGGTGTVTSIRANTGLLVSGGATNPITTSGGLEVDFTKVVATSLYNAAGTLLVGGGAGTITQLPVGTSGQILQVSQSGQVEWATVPSASPATPTTYGLVYGQTNQTSTYYGYGAGQSVTGENNVLIGDGTGSNVGAGVNNTFLGAYQGYPGLSDSVALATGAGAVRFFANSAGAWSLSGDAQFGQAGQVLSSQGQNSPPQWVTPVNAPITDVNDGPGISTDINGTTLTINNEGVLSVTSSSPIVATTTNGNVTLSGPNILTDVVSGTGISITGSGNTRTIANAGIVSLTNGLNTVVTQVTPGVWKVDSSGGGGGTITSLTEGAGIDITNPLGPNPTITNSGVLSIQDGPNIVPDVNAGNVTLSLQNVVFSVTAGSGITVGGTATNPTIANSGVISLQNGTGTTVQNVGGGVWQVNATGTAGVTKIIAGSNVSITPVSGTGEVTINAAGGGGGGNITEIKSGAGITVNSGTGPVTTITNNGVLSLTAGTNTSITGTANNPVINSVGSLNSLKSGKGISITGATGPEATIVNTGVVGLVAGANVTVQETATGSGIFNISASGGGGGGAVASVTGNGPGISVSPTTGAVVVQNTGVTSLTGTTGNITVSGSSGAVTLNIGSNVLTNVTAGNSGITVAGTGNTRSISAAVTGLTAGAGVNLTNNSGNFTIENTGVLGLTAGSNVTITETTPGSGNFTIASTGGGGGGTGTVTSIATGFGLSGGTITTSGTLTIDQNAVVNRNSFGGYGSLLYGAFGGGWKILESPADASLNGTFYFLGTSNIVGEPQWRTTQILTVADTPSIKWNSVVLSGGARNASVPTDWLISNAIPWTTLTDPIGTAGSMVYAERDLPPPFIGSGVGTAILYPGNIGDILTMASGSTINPRKPAWVSPNSLPFVKTITGTAPITVNSTTASSPVIGFDVNTTALTAYVPKSAFSLSGQLLYGTGAGTYSALNIGDNGQVLSVNSSGALEWITPPDPTPSNPVSITAADDSIVVDPDPITGTGTIGVTPGKFIESAVLGPAGIVYGAPTTGDPSRLTLTPGSLVYGASSTGVPTVLSAPATTPTATNWLVSSGGTPSWKSFFASTGTNSVSLGSGAYYNAANGTTIVGAGTQPTTSDAGSSIAVDNQVAIGSGNGPKMFIYGTGALAFPRNGGELSPYAGRSGYVLTSNGNTTNPSWNDPFNQNGSSCGSEIILLNAADSAVIFDASFLWYFKIIVEGYGKYALSQNPQDYERRSWIQEYEYTYLPNLSRTDYASSGQLALVRTIRSVGPANPTFYYAVSYNSSSSRIEVKNLTSGQDPEWAQVVKVKATVYGAVGRIQNAT